MKNKLTLKRIYLSAQCCLVYFWCWKSHFPIHLGQTAGSNVWTANLGFLITAIGLPFLGIIAIGVSKTNGVFEISSRISKIYGYLFLAYILL